MSKAKRGFGGESFHTLRNIGGKPNRVRLGVISVTARSANASLWEKPERFLLQQGFLSSAGSIRSIRNQSDFSTGHRDCPLNHFQLVVNDGPIAESRQRSSVFQEKHKGLGKIFARVRRRIVRDELLKKTTIEEFQFPLLARTATLASLIIWISFQMPAP